MRDITGEQFGRWVVRGMLGKNKHGQRLCEAECQCGVKRPVAVHQLVSGLSKSCGCITLDRLTKHGEAGHDHNTRSAEYHAWHQLNDRCLKTNRPGSPNYSGRGITVCVRWRRGTPNAFENFLTDILSTIGRRPSPEYTIDRIDNNGDYEPGNIQWATPKQQSRNKRTNRLLTLNGVTKTLIEWSEITGINRQTIKSRIDRSGWSIEQALTTPVGCKPS